MATHNSLFSDKDVRRTRRRHRRRGAASLVPQPLAVGGRRRRGIRQRRLRCRRTTLRFELNGTSYRIEELPEQWDTLWFVADKPEVVIPLDHAPAAGEKLTVEVVLTMRLLYMQIMPGVDGGPGRYVTNRVPVEREVVLA